MDARYLVAFGFLTVALALLRMTNLNLGIDYRTAMLWRMYQAVGIAFLFVPINTISYAGMAREASNQVSGMINLMRNIGGSVGISTVTSLIARRQQIHQSYLAQNTFEFNPRLQEMLSNLTAQFGLRTDAAQATQQAYGRIYAGVERQAAVLAYIDAFSIMGVVCVLAIGLLFFAKKNKPGRASMGH